MTLQISLPEELAGELSRRAIHQKRTAQEIVIDLLNRALGLDQDEYLETPEEVVARIKALPKNPSVAASSRSFGRRNDKMPQQTKFDLDEWEKEWAKVEAEMRDMTLLDDIREGRA